MKFEIEIDEEELQQAAKEIAVHKMSEVLFNRFQTYEGNVLRKAYKDICREVIYAEKDRIIDRVVAQATAEVKKKSIHRILEMMDAEGEA